MKSISPRALLILAAFSLAVVIACAVTALVVRSRAIPTGLQHRTMPDGTVLVLERVTTGGANQYAWLQRTLLPAPFQQPATGETESFRSGIVLWFSRFDPKTGKSLDFDWWLRGAAVDDAGNEIEDMRCGYDCFWPDGRRGYRGSHPFSPQSEDGWELMVAHAQVWPIRHSGKSFKYRLYDTANTLVAEFDVPHEVPPGPPQWVLEPLPVSKHVEDLDVTVTGLTVTDCDPNASVLDTSKNKVVPILGVLRDGQTPRIAFHEESWFEDVFGNQTVRTEYRPSPYEPMWKLYVRLWPMDDGDSVRSSVWNAGVFPLPGEGTSSAAGAAKVVGGVNLTWLGIGGTGSVSHTHPDPTFQSGGGARHTGAGDYEYRVEFGYGGGKATASVQSSMTHLLLHTSGLNADRWLQVRVRDDQGRDVETYHCGWDGPVVVFMKTEPDAKSVDVTFVVKRPTQVEYFVAPPAEMRGSE